ncbi:MAG: hypothetical protein INF91_10660 [Alphaproteobacteria bacterium]|nr:hypothetical protein [Alphaproteobacteria bacterium]
MISGDLYPELPAGTATEQLRALCDRWSTFRVKIWREGDEVCCQAGDENCHPRWSAPIVDDDVQAARQTAARHAVDYWGKATIRPH